MKLYIGVGGREKNDMALKENNSNEEPTAGAAVLAAAPTGALRQPAGPTEALRAGI